MDVKLNESISTTILEGLKFIQGISKHLPEDLTNKTQSVTLSFQKLLRVLCEAKRMCVPELNSRYATRRHTCTSVSDEQVELDYEATAVLTPTADKVIDSCFSNIDERKPMNIPAETTNDKYLVIQENHSSKVPTNSHTPRIRLNIKVNNELKGMYYCLIENGLLLLDRKVNTEHSEYVISLSDYTFQAVNNFTITLTKNEFEIALLFCSKTDHNTWVKYLTTARESVYSYVTVDRCSVTPTRSPKIKLNPSNSMPIRKCKSVDTILQPDDDFVDMSILSLEFAAKSYEMGLKTNLTRNNVKAPLPIPPNNYSNDSMEKVTPKRGLKRFRRYLPLKQVKSAPNNTIPNVIPEKPRVAFVPYENIIIHSKCQLN